MVRHLISVDAMSRTIVAMSTLVLGIPTVLLASLASIVLSPVQISQSKRRRRGAVRGDLDRPDSLTGGRRVRVAMGPNSKRRVAPASTMSPSAADDPPSAIGSTSLILAVLAALIGFFFSQLQQLYIELNSLDDAHTSTADAVQSHTAIDEPSGRGVASIVVDWGAERRLQKKQQEQEQEQEQNNHEPTDEIVENISSIVKKYVDRNEPFVCRRCMMPESLGGWWDVDANLLEAIGADTVMPIRVAESSTNRNPTQFQRSAESDAKHQTTEKSAYQEKNMTASDFFSQYKDHSGLGHDEHWYAAQVDVVTQLPGLLKYIASSAAPKHQLMEAVGPTPSTSRHPVTIYFGAGERTTQLHYDSLENVVCLASGGTKTFALYDPVSSSKYLYIDRSVHGNFSPANPTNPDPNHPMAKFALPSMVTLSVGDCLYLPVYWYHTVTSSNERTISINWWRSPNTQKMSVLESIFCGRKDYGAGAKC